MQKVHDFLKAAGTYYLATADYDQSRVRPFGTIHMYATATISAFTHEPETIQF